MEQCTVRILPWSSQVIKTLTRYNPILTVTVPTEAYNGHCEYLDPLMLI